MIEIDQRQRRPLDLLEARAIHACTVLVEQTLTSADYRLYALAGIYYQQRTFTGSQ